MPSLLTGSKESATRKRIDTTLTNLGWNCDEFSAKCNVFTERAKIVEQNKMFHGKKPDYVLYKSGTDRPIAIIEAKKGGQDLQDALRQAIDLYAKPLGVRIIFVTDGSVVQTHDRRSGTPLRLDGETISDFLSEARVLQFIEKGPDLFTPDKVSHTKRELIRIFSDANDLLRKEGMRQGVERFTEFSNLLFLKLISEIEAEREVNGERRILEPEYCWEAFCDRDPADMMRYINDTILPRLANKYNHSGDVFQRQLLIKTPETLKRIVDQLSRLSLFNTDSDVKGDAFEYFLRNSVMVRNDLGEYFTPRHIVKLIVDLLDPKYGETIYDPCCGTGGFLIQAFRHVKRKVRPTKKVLDFLQHTTIYGGELTGTAKIAKMNMIIIGDGHNNIVQQDSLREHVRNRFHVILTNFPFSQQTDYSSLYGFKAEDANPVFLKHIIDALKPSGRAGVVVPEGLLFDDKGDYIRARKVLMDTCNVYAVIQLHEYAFEPYTSQPTSILLFEKGKQTKDVWFFAINNDGFKKTTSRAGRAPIKEDDLVLLRQVWDVKPESDHSFTVSASRIQENQYKLSMDCYRRRGSQKKGYVRLGDVCDVVIGGTPSRNSPAYWGGDNLWVKISDMGQGVITDTADKITDKAINESSVKLLQPGTVLFSFKLTVGRTAIAGKKLYTNEAIAGLVPKDARVEPRYLCHLLPRIDYASYMQSATKGKTLNQKIIREIMIPLPSPKVQRAIIRNIEAKERSRLHLLRQADAIRQQEDKLLARWMR